VTKASFWGDLILKGQLGGAATVEEKAAVASDSDWVLTTSFSNWQEGTEPGVEHRTLTVAALLACNPYVMYVTDKLLFTVSPHVI